MLNDPEVDLLLEKLGEKGKTISRFELCSVASKRARQIIGAREVSNGKILSGDSALSLACKEIAEGKVVLGKD